MSPGGHTRLWTDGDLYISVGDDEQSDRAQELGVLTGKILRIDVSSSQPYAIPPSNPFTQSDARGEIWAYGLRNPWRFSFDRITEDMWIGDVHHVDDGPGADTNWESVEFQPASVAGLNYGFPMRATFHCADIASCRPAGVTLPVTEFEHNMRCSITGGQAVTYPTGVLETVRAHGEDRETWQPEPGVRNASVEPPTRSCCDTIGFSVSARWLSVDSGSGGEHALTRASSADSPLCCNRPDAGRRAGRRGRDTLARPSQ